MAIHVALTHRTRYHYDRRVGLSPHVIRLRPAPHCRSKVLSYSLKIEPAAENGGHFVNWQQDPFANYQARLVFPEKTTQFKVTVDLVVEMAVYNPFDFFLEPEAEEFPFKYTPELKQELLPYLDADPVTPLVQAYLDCRATKRNTASAQAFEAKLEHNLFQLAEELASGGYQPGRSICFVITRPKPREVWAADFRDRIVHHLLYNHISPRFHARFVANSCACIPGRGTLYAAQRLEHGVRSVTQNWSQPAHYLKCDLANFFVAIDKSTSTSMPSSTGMRMSTGAAQPWVRTSSSSTSQGPSPHTA